jgi:hypothetical protein
MTVRSHSVAQLPGSPTVNDPIAMVLQTLLLRNWTENVLFSILFQTFPDGQFVGISKQEFCGGRGLMPSDESC